MYLLSHTVCVHEKCECLEDYPYADEPKALSMSSFYFKSVRSVINKMGFPPCLKRPISKN